jgi:GNAT superfamily N-acetyltransferase
VSSESEGPPTVLTQGIAHNPEIRRDPACLRHSRSGEYGLESEVGARPWGVMSLAPGPQSPLICRRSSTASFDTATHPDYQGRGIFTRLRTSSLETLRERGVAHVCNTPHEQTLPGHLKMGWQQVGKLPVGERFRSPTSAASALRPHRFFAASQADSSQPLTSTVCLCSPREADRGCDVGSTGTGGATGTANAITRACP